MPKHTPRIPRLLTIAGSDSSGGAGLQADLKTFAALGAYGASVVTAVTAQNTRGVTAIHGIPVHVVRAQIDAVFADLSIDAVKIGMLGDEDLIDTVVEALTQHRPRYLVVDPVMVATSGAVLLPEGARDALRSLFPLADVITPNLPEAEALLGRPFDPATFDVEGAGFGARAVLVKGGHSNGSTATDLLWRDGHVERFDAPRIATERTHGTGCSLASAIAVGLAEGRPLDQAVARAKRWLHGALAGADALAVGRGHGPVDHGWAQRLQS